MIVYSICPVCKSNRIKLFKAVKDHSVSHENFDLYECEACSLRFTQSVPDIDSIGRYYQSDDYISHTDSKKGVFNFTYQLIRSYALKSKRNLIERFSSISSGHLLDYGCGTGAFLKEMSSHGWEIDGIEPDPGARLKASELTGTEIYSTDKSSKLTAGYYDVITLWHVLEHVHQLDETLSELKKSLKPSGKLIIAVPNYTSFDAQFYDVSWAAYDVPRHLYHFSPQSMRLLMPRLGLEVREIKPMWFDSFYVSLLSEKYLKGRMNFIRALYTGFKSNFLAFFNKEKCSSVIYLVEMADH